MTEALPTQTTEKNVEPVSRPYAPPRLVVHGTAAILTGDIDTGPNDKLGGSLPDL